MADNFEVREPRLRALFNTVDGHDHDGVNSKAVVGGAPAADSVTNAMIKSDAGIVSTKLSAAVQASLALADTALQPGEIELEGGTPTNAAAAAKTLSIAGVVIDGETVTIGSDVYEFCADAAQSLTAGSTIAVDITSYVTASQGTLTLAAQPTVGDTMTIGTKLYNFVAPASVNGDGDISIGTDLPSAKLAVVAAINGTDSVNTASTFVSAAEFAVDDCVLTALVGGVAGDAIATTETFDNVGNIFDAVVLGTTTAGSDCTAANGVTALVAGITASDTAGVGAADGAGDTVVCTADAKGTAGNSIVIAEDMANGSWAGGAVALSGGVAGTVGTQWQTYVDATYLYVCVATNTVDDANWRRIALGSAY